MFKHIFINRFKISVREKAMLFWTLLFPLVLGTFFNFAFSNLTSAENFEAIDIALVEKETNDSNFLMMLNSLSEGEDKIFNLTSTDEKEAKKLLEENKITGYITADETINFVTDTNGLNQTIVKSVIDNYLQMSSSITSIISNNPDIKPEEILETLNIEREYFKDSKTENTDATVIYFYTLIAFTCMSAAFWGSKTINETEGNLSQLGTRLCISPVNKFKVLLYSLFVALLIQFGETLIVLNYLTLILKVAFGSDLIYIILICLIGCLAGLTFGAVVSSALKKDEMFKTNVLSSCIMVCSFLSGMMMIDMKILIQKNVPILGYINPVNLITDALYSLYYYDTYTRFYSNILYLLIFSVIMIIIAYMLMRRKKYDSI